MYDMNLSVPNITATRYSDDERFLLLKNYLYELNDMLNYALQEKEQGITSLINDVKKENSDSNNKAVLMLSTRGVNKLNQLKEQIIRTANDIEVDYKAEITKTQESIIAEVEKNFVSQSEFGEYSSQISTELSQTADKINLISTNSEAVGNDLETFKETAMGEISLTASNIISKVEEVFETKESAAELENRISSEIIQTKNNITEVFSDDITALSQDIGSVGGEVSQLISDLDVYIRRGELSEGVYGIEIGRSDSNIKARFTNDRLSFFQGNGEVAYISGSSLYITNVQVLDYLKIGNDSQGNFLFDITSNGLEVRWIDID